VRDDALIKAAMQLAKMRTRREAVDTALRAYVSRGKLRNILALVDEGLIAPDYDVRGVRRRMARNTR
jgi:Arc/MetJ family transcription regulator